VKILVCIKDVPDEPAAMESAGDGYPRAGESMVRRMDRLSEYALEMALAMKDNDPAVVVDTVGAGPPSVNRTLKRSLEMGSDRAFRIDVTEVDTWQPERVAAVLGDFTRGCGYDLIMTGAMSEDLMQGITGPLLAAELKLPTAPAVMETVYDKEKSNLLVTCELEGGVREKARMALPALLTVQSGPRNPRYPSLTSKLRARQQEVNLVPGLKKKGPVPPGEYIFEKPEPLGLVSMIEGTPEEKARDLIEIFREAGVL